MFVYRWDETSKHSFAFNNGGTVDVIDNETGLVLHRDVRYRLARIFETEGANIVEFLQPLHIGGRECGGLAIRGEDAVRKIRETMRKVCFSCERSWEAEIRQMLEERGYEVSFG